MSSFYDIWLGQGETVGTENISVVARKRGERGELSKAGRNLFCCSLVSHGDSYINVCISHNS